MKTYGFISGTAGQGVIQQRRFDESGIAFDKIFYDNWLEVLEKVESGDRVIIIKDYALGRNTNIVQSRREMLDLIGVDLWYLSAARQVDTLIKVTSELVEEVETDGLECFHVDGLHLCEGEIVSLSSFEDTIFIQRVDGSDFWGLLKAFITNIEIVSDTQLDDLRGKYRLIDGNSVGASGVYMTDENTEKIDYESSDKYLVFSYRVPDGIARLVFNYEDTEDNEVVVSGFIEDMRKNTEVYNRLDAILY